MSIQYACPRQKMEEKRTHTVCGVCIAISYSSGTFLPNRLWVGRREACSRPAGRRRASCGNTVDDTARRLQLEVGHQCGPTAAHRRPCFAMNRGRSTCRQHHCDLADAAVIVQRHRKLEFADTAFFPQANTHLCLLHRPPHHLSHPHVLLTHHQ